MICPVLGRAQVGIVNGLTQEKICKPGEAFQSFITIRVVPVNRPIQIIDQSEVKIKKKKGED